MESTKCFDTFSYFKMLAKKVKSVSNSINSGSFPHDLFPSILIVVSLYLNFSLQCVNELRLHKSKDRFVSE